MFILILVLLEGHEFVRMCVTRLIVLQRDRMGEGGIHFLSEQNFKTQNQIQIDPDTLE